MFQYEHHRATVENLEHHFEKQGGTLALIVCGSVGRGDAGECSDVDYYLVVDDAVFAARVAQDAVYLETNECCVPPCPEANGFLTSIAALREIQERGNEIDRYSFYQARIIFSRDGEIDTLVSAIPRYPEKDRIRRMESYHSQIFYHFSFFEFAYLSQTKYLIYETATKMILSIGRLILADNRILYPNRKRFYRELQRAPDKPEGICEAMLAFLDHPTIDGGSGIIDMIQKYKAYPVPPEGMKARIVKESLLNLEAW